MGVAINDLLIKEEIDIDSLSGKVLVVDAPLWLYQFLSSIRQPDGSLLSDSRGNITSHLIGLSSRIPKLMGKDIKLAFCFDGKVPELKNKERERRKELKIEAEKKYKEAAKKKDLVEMKKYAARTTRLTKDMIEEAKNVLQAFGIPVIEAPSEAEAQASCIVKNKDAFAVATNDADVLMFGAPKLVRNLNIAGKRKKTNKLAYEAIKPELVDLAENLNHLGIDNDQLIALSMLVGSVDHNEPTIITNDEEIKITQIGDFINSIANENIKVPCFDFNTKKITFKPLLKAIKHKINEPLYEVKLSYGRNVRVTASHSLFRKKGDKIEAVKTTNLTKNDEIVVPIKIPHNKKPTTEINLAYELWKNKDKIIRGIYCDGKNVAKILKKRLLSKKRGIYPIDDRIVILTKLGMKKIRDVRASKKIPQRKIPILSESSVYSWEKGRYNPTERLLKKYLKYLNVNLNFLSNKKYVEKINLSTIEMAIHSGRGIKAKHHRTILFSSPTKEEVAKLDKNDILYGFKKNGIKPIIKITPELMRLIGYYVAEGHLSGNYRISFSFAKENIGHDNYCVKDLCNCIKKVFGVTPFVYDEKTNRNICIDNIVVHSLFAHILGFNNKNSHTKHIPFLVFNVTPKMQLNFLKGYFLGDGTINSRMITFATRSKKLAIDLSYLLPQLGIISSYDFKGPNNYNMNAVTVCGKSQLQKLKIVWSKHNKAKILKNHCDGPTKKSLGLKIINDLGFVKIKSIKKVKPSNEYVYDFSVKGENFIAGLGGVCCHNTDFNIAGIKGIGPKNALKLVKKYKSNFDDLFKEAKWSENFKFPWTDVFYLIKKMPVTNKYKLEWKDINKDKILNLLVDKHDFSEERVNNTLNKLLKESEKKKQKGLGDFF